MMSEEMNRMTTVSIDQDTDEGLDWLKQTLDSPKAWIVRRLVTQEIERLRSETDK